MEKFISLFLVSIMVICNLNTGVVDALSSCSNEVKSLINTLTKTEEEKIVDEKENKGLASEIETVPVNNDSDKTEVVGSENKEKNKDKIEKSSQKKSPTDNKAKMKQNVVLFYDIGSEIFYYIDSENKPQELSLMNEKSIKDKNKINLNNILKYNNLAKDYNIFDKPEVTIVITGTGSYTGLSLDNDYYENIPFNIVFYNMNGEHCSFLFENIKSIRVNGENTIENSYDDETALTYSFDGSDLSPLTIDDGSSFIVYNEDKDNINSNIVYSGNLSEDDSQNSEDDSQNSEDDSQNSGYSSIINISFEEDNLLKGKNFILEPAINNNGTRKKFSTRDGYDVLSILLVSDYNNYLLKEENNQIPYYYRESNSIEDNEIQGSIKTKITLDKNIINDCYEINNKPRVEVIATKKNTQNYYLIDNLNEAMNNCVDLNGATHEVIFLGDYKINTEDIEAIKNYSRNTDGITFKTQVDDYKYLLNVDKDIELMVKNSNQFTINFDYIKFRYASNDKCIYANGNQLKFGDNVEMEGTNYPSILLGGKKVLSSDFKKVNNSYLTINSGTYNYVIGDYYGTLQNVNINIYGGTFKSGVIGVNNILQNNDGTNNVTLTINNGIFECKVYGVGTSSNINGNLDMKIKGGTFQNDVIPIDGRVGKDATINIKNGTFNSKVCVENKEGYIVGSLNTSINGGTFRNQVIAINGGKVNSAIVTITNGTFYNNFIGASSSTTIEKFTLNGLLDRYSFNNTRINNGQIPYSEYDGVSINLDIRGGNFRGDVIGTEISDSTLIITVSKGSFKGDLIGNDVTGDDNATIYINGSVTIPTISDFTKLVVGEAKKGIVLKVDKLDKKSLTGDLYLNNESKVLFTSSNETSKLKNIILDGANNTLSLSPNNRNKNTVLVELSGELRNKDNRLNIELTKTNSKIDEIYLIKFTMLEEADVMNKYAPQDGYYVRDNKDSEAGYVMLCPQITSDLKYNFDNNKLSVINNDNEVDAWWYTEYDKNSENINLDTNKLYTYKGYNLFKDTKNKNRNIILTGNGLNKNIKVNNDLENLNNINVVLEGINLTDSTLSINNIKSLTLRGENIINSNSINKDQAVFSYTFDNNSIDDKVLFDGDNSHLRILTQKDIKPFNEYKEDSMDFKFLESFKSSEIVRLKDDIGNQISFNIPKGTQRLGVLLNSQNNVRTYKLYHGEAGEKGNSVYVSGEREETFKNTFSVLLNNGQAYEYVRRAKPYKSIQMDIPNLIDFTLDTTSSGYYGINLDNWHEYFKATDIKIKNDSTVIEDQFILNGETKYFGKKNLGLEVGYLGTSPSQGSKNDIVLISKEKLTPSMLNDQGIVKLALKLDDISIDESEVKETPSKIWSIPSKSYKILKIYPDFNSKGYFFSVDPELSAKIKSSHRFIYRVGFKES